MKKSRLLLAVKKAMKPYYKIGLTNTASQVRDSIVKEINKAYLEKHKKH